MSLLTPGQSISQKRFRQCVNHKKKPSLRHPFPTFGGFNFFRHPFASGSTKSYKRLKNLFTAASWYPWNVRLRPHFNTQCRGAVYAHHFITLPQMFSCFYFQVWDVVATEGLANFRGHTSRVFCCIWGNEPDLIMTGGEIFFLFKSCGLVCYFGLVFVLMSKINL